jgi:type VI secretion system protein ImpH
MKTPPTFQEPWKYNFTALMRKISADNVDQPAVGKAQKPKQERFKIGQVANLGFAPREIASIEALEGVTKIKLFGLGMLGPNGPLPLHFTELVRERVEAKRDNTLVNFLNLFHHRALTLQHAAWAQSQSAAGLDRADEETFTNFVARLLGDEPKELQSNELPPHARWASAAHRVRQSRNPEGLVGTLKRFFDVPVKLHEFQLNWIPLQEVDQCRLGRPMQSSVLGLGAMAGDSVPDKQTRFRLQIGPLSLENYLKLTPSSLAQRSDASGEKKANDLISLIEWVRAFIGFEYEWEVELLVKAGSAPPVRLGDRQQLGWSTWMGTPLGDKAYAPVSGMVYQPERYY